MKGKCVNTSVALLLLVVLIVQAFICLTMVPKVAVKAASGISDNGYEQATILRNSQANRSKISPVGSVDWFEIRIDVESDAVIQTYGLPGDTGDIVMNLYYQNLTFLTSGNNGGSGLFSKISVHLSASIYYVATMENGNNSEISEYYINVTYASIFQKTYGGSNFDVGRCVKQTSDGGYVIAGWTNSSGAGGLDVYLVKTDSDGVMQWNCTYGGAGDDAGYSVQQTVDGGFIVAGYTRSYGAGGSDVYLVKTNSSGVMQWNCTYGGAGDDAGYSVQQTLNGGYIVAGYAGSSGVYLAKTSSNGTMEWNRTYGGTIGYSVQQTSDGGYVIAGYEYTWPTDSIYLIKTNSSGSPQWTKTYGGTLEWWYGYYVQQTSDGGYIIAGDAYYYFDGTYFCLVKTDSNGNVQWRKTYGGGSDVGYCVQQTLDGGYIVAGYTKSYGAGGSDVYLVKTNSSGVMQWNCTYGGAGDDAGYCVQQTSDKGYVIVGNTISFGAGNQDIYLIKTSQDGYSPSYRDVILDEGTTLIPKVVYSILHDPPGDGSYSTIDQTNTTSTETTLSGGAGCTVGFEGEANFLGNGVSASSQVSINTSGSRSDAFEETYQEGLSSSTDSNDPLYIGPGRGDVFFGESWLLHYRVVSRTYINGTTKTIMEYGPTRVGSTFAVTATWIRDNVQEPWRSQLLGMDLGLDNVVDISSGKASLLDTKTISGGIDYHQSYSVTARSSNSFTFEVEMSYDVATQCGFTILGVGASGKAEVGLNFGVGITQATSQTRTTEIGYHIIDHDSSNTLVVKIYYDKVFGTYMFTAEPGTTTTNPIEAYEHDIAVTNVNVSTTIVGQGYSLDIGSTVKNLGLYAETFNVTAYANSTEVGTKQVTALSSRNYTELVFNWNTTGFAYGQYCLNVTADPVPLETDTTNNNLADGWVTVTIPLYFSVEPIPISPLADINASFNGLETPATPSPIGKYFVVEIHLRGATLANVPYGVKGVEIHFNFTNILYDSAIAGAIVQPVSFIDELGTAGGALVGPQSSLLYGLSADWYDNTDTAVPIGSATQYEVAASSTKGPWNGTDGLVAIITFQIIGQPSSPQPDFYAPLQISGSDVRDAAAVKVPHYVVEGTVNIGALPLHDVAVTNVTSSKTECLPMPTVGQNLTATVNVTVVDTGGYNESTVNVTAYATQTTYYNTTTHSWALIPPILQVPVSIGSTIVSLNVEQNTTITFTWNTTGFAYGNYTISATAGPVPGETNTGDNTLTDGTIIVTIRGDMNGDFHVDLGDLVLLSNAYGTSPSQPVKGACVWNPNADIDGNLEVDLGDLVLLANNYRQHYP